LSALAVDNRSEKTGADLGLPFSAILDRARALDGQALGMLYERYLPVVYRYVFLRVGDVHLAEDVTSDVFFTMVEHIEQLRAADELAFAAWILRIARNTVAAHYRRVRTQPLLIEQSAMTDLTVAGSAEAGDPLAVITSREDWSEVVDALHHLTKEQRNVVIYRCLLGYSTEEVGELLRKQPGTIRALQFRALASLTRLLGQTVEGDGGHNPSVTTSRRRRGDGSGG
jgi:RNA polymerase sigma-70 factor (ECF subfamily)